MNIAVMGAGAVGCYYGGMLARAGHAVTLITRPQHVSAIAQNGGLLLDTQSFREHVPVTASSEASAVRGTELVLFCVKSTDTQAAGAAMAPHLAPGALLLSLQNGVDNAERLQAVLGGRTVEPAVVYVGTEMAGPGHVKHLGRGELVVGPAVATPERVAAFRDAGIPLHASDNVIGALWSKLILNCAYNALSAITRLPYGVLRPAPGVEAVMRDVVAECLAVAGAAGVTVPGDAWEGVERIAATMPGQFSSTAQDVMRGKPSEIDHLNGYVVARGQALGVATPANRVLHTLVKLIEQGQEAAPATTSAQ